MDLGRLRALDAVATCGSVLAAADALHITPSAVSQQLAKLDRETGTRLLERDGRGLRLTDAGHILAAHAARVLAAVDEAESALAAYHQEVTGTISIAAFATACRGLLPRALAELAAKHPQLSTRIAETNPYEAMDALTRGRAEVVVADDWPEIGLVLPEGVAHVTLGHDRADLIVPSGHRLAGAPAGPLARAAGERWIASPPGTICHDWLLRVLPGVRPDFLVGEFETQQTLVAAGLGVALIPRLARTHTVPGTAVVPVEPGPTRRVVVAWRKATEVRPALGATVAALRTAWADRATA
ncbi:MAG: LysR family transcriptional regulator [Hamadaea sp.]|nr:LysR family transcriptional regulator [Hamadaea sp.]NUR51162.1 LysR family transcriptional regulator [Hamadaea sp.]NUT02828.1 LysR family transcriptional regulator [Hamadaea sp.]